MKRILIIGSCGAGKSKLTKDLGGILKLPVIHLDTHYWKPGWVQTPTQEWKQIVEELISGNEWIMDGNYGGTLTQRLEAADAVIFLNYSRYLCLLRVLNRQFLRQRVDPIPGCYEKMDFEFIKWIWNYPRKSRPRIMKILDECGDGKKIHICNTPGDAKRLVDKWKVGR